LEQAAAELSRPIGGQVMVFLRNIVLIGFTGVGKTAVGRRLAGRLGRPFVDTDREIEQLYGMKVSDIFRRYGEVRFRSEEAILARKLAGQSGLVVPPGGGLIVDAENGRLLRESGILIGLTADLDTIHSRIRGKRDRPLLKGDHDLRSSLEKLRADRVGVYDVAEFTVETDGLSSWQVVERIVAYLNGGRER
jgi:shikimate kinase